jgi:hypothetical protein
MKTNSRMTTTLVMGVLALVLVLFAIYGLPKLQEASENDNIAEATDEEPVPDPLFPDEQSATVMYVRVVDNEENKALAATMDFNTLTWTVDEAPEDADMTLDVDSSRLLTAVTSIPTIIPERVLDEIEALGTYGLGEPRYTIEFTTTEGKTHTLKIGSANPGGSAYYTKVDNLSGIYLIPVYYVDQVLQLLTTLPLVTPMPEGTGEPTAEPTDTEG